MRSVFLTMAVCGCWLAAGVQAYTPSGNITVSETWSSASATDTLRITGDIVVLNNATLTIQPGTKIRGYNGTQANVRHIRIQATGVISAVGTAANPIVMVNTYFDIADMTRDSLCLLKYIKFSKGWVSLLWISAIRWRAAANSPSCLSKTAHSSRRVYCQIYVTSGGCPTCNNCTFINNLSNTTVGQMAIFIHGGGTSTFNYCTFSNFSGGMVSASYGVSADPGYDSDQCQPLHILQHNRRK